MNGKVYILAKSSDQEDVYWAVSTWLTGYDSIEEAKTGINDRCKAIAELNLTNDNIISDDDIKVVLEL